MPDHVNKTESEVSCNDRCLHELAAADSIQEMLVICQSDPDQVHHTNEDLETPLHVSAVEGRLAATELLLSKGANPNARDIENYTPLMLAVKFGKEHVAKVLAQLGDVNVVNDSCQAALHIAIETGQLEMVKLLFENGADPHLLDGGGYLPFYIAITQRHFDIAWEICRHMDVKRYFAKN